MSHSIEWVALAHTIHILCAKKELEVASCTHVADLVSLHDQRSSKISFELQELDILRLGMTRDALKLSFSALLALQFGCAVHHFKSAREAD